MKLTSLRRLLVPAALAVATLASAGCPSRAVTPAPPPVVQQPTDGDLTADGKHFAVSRVYKGECMPAGSRGGCYSITLEPDGHYRNWLLDAAISGTYEIAGAEVRFTPEGDAPPSTMTLSGDRSKLDDYTYEPAVEP